jgi:hypothetical protein
MSTPEMLRSNRLPANSRLELSALLVLRCRKSFTGWTRPGGRSGL